MKKFLATFLLIIITIFLIYTNYIKQQKDTLETKNLNLKLGDNLPISRSLVAKMVSLLLISKDDILNLNEEIKFLDVKKDTWYYKYINFFIKEKLIDIDSNKFYPEKPLTIEEAQKILNKIDKNNKIEINLTKENKDKPISYALWCELYCKLIKNLNQNNKNKLNILEKNYIVLATENNSLLTEGYIITDKGLLISEGIVNDYYLDKEIKVLEKEGEVIAILNINNEEPTIKNAYIINSFNDNIIIFSGGVERNYKLTNNIIEKNINGKLCDIKIKDNICLNINIHKEIKKGKIKNIDNNYIELDKEKIKIDEDFKAYYLLNGKVKTKQLQNITTNIDTIEIILKNNKAVGAIINSKFINKIENDKINNNENNIDKIRVAISSTNFKSLLHKDVILTSTTDFKVIENNKEKSFKKGEILNFKKNNNFVEGNKVYIKPENNGKIEIRSIKRNYKNNEYPKYRGIIEITNFKDGLVIVNELPFEEYLYSVVSSEIPKNYGLEAAKAQAIISRSYAYNEFYKNRFYKYNANIDDSTKSQVYNNTLENELAKKSVDLTKGIYVLFNEKVADTKFFSTSAGITANSGEVWANNITNEFPQNTKEYLKSSNNFNINKNIDLSKEENAKKFFKNKDIDSFDKFSPWFRWNVEMTIEEIEESINKNLKYVYKNNPALIKVLQKDKTFKQQNIDTIGKLKKIEILKRSKSGNIMEIKIQGNKNTILVMTEYNIRNLIKPKKYLKNGKDIKLNRLDGTYLLNYFIMPSSFYVMENIKDNKNNIIAIKFYGGGNGHGVGLSQSGAKTMAERGYNYKDILLNYYNKIKIGKIT